MTDNKDKYLTEGEMNLPPVDCDALQDAFTEDEIIEEVIEGKTLGEIIEKRFPGAQYYLHKNGELILKQKGGVDETSDFVVKCWFCRDIYETPEVFLNFLKEAQQFGAPNNSIVQALKLQNLQKFIPDCFEQLGVLDDKL